MPDLFLKLIKLRRRISLYKRSFNTGASGIYFSKARGENGIDGRCTILTDPDCHISEQIRTIRTQLLFRLSEKNIKTFLITSSFRSEGKSVTACNLAAAIAQDKSKKVLLVDTDLRKAHVHEIFNIPREPGLAEILTGKTDTGRFTSAPAADNLYVIPAGSQPPNPSDLIGSPKMKDLIISLKESFNIVIFDTPPVIPVTDASVLAGIVEGFVLIVRAKFVIAMDVERALYMLENAGAQPLGAVMTHLVEHMPSYFHKYKYNYMKYSKY